jgi:hypothetical protein
MTSTPVALARNYPRADAGSWLGEILMSPEVNGLLPEWPLAGVGPTAISWPTAVE